SNFMAGAGLKYNDLMTAVLAKDVAAVNELLKLGRWVDKPDSRGRTPLMVATAQDDVPTAEALLRGGASPSPAVRVAEQRGNGEKVALLKRYTRGGKGSAPHPGTRLVRARRLGVSRRPRPWRHPGLALRCRLRARCAISRTRRGAGFRRGAGRSGHLARPSNRLSGPRVQRRRHDA